jgi:hypothetical protein
MPRPYPRAVEALDHHNNLLRWWSRNIYAPPFAQSFAETHPEQLGRPIDEYLTEKLNVAETVYVTAEISNRLWEFSKQHTTDSAPLHPDDLFMDNGYIWFQDPLLMTDVRGRIVTIRAMCWFRDPDKLRVFYFNDKMHEMDELTRIMEEETGQPAGENIEPRTPLFHFESHEFGKPLFHRNEQMTTDSLAASVIAHDMQTALKEGTGRLEWRERDDIDPATKRILRAAEESGSDIVTVGDGEPSGAWYFTYNYERKRRDGAYSADTLREIEILREHKEYLERKHEGLNEVLARLQAGDETVTDDEQSMTILADAMNTIQVLNNVPETELTKRGTKFQYHIDPETGKMSDWFTEETLQKHLEDVRAVNRFLLALWGWMGEQIPFTVPASRPARRRLERSKVQFPSEVQVVDLRIQEQDPWAERNPNPAMILWSRRWKVREHKRRWFDKHGNYRETTVHSYVKGPAHLPLIERDRVFNVRQ